MISLLPFESIGAMFEALCYCAAMLAAATTYLFAGRAA